MAIRIVQVDAFTNKPFAGNPAAVCVLPEAAPEEWMRHVAREMNLSETAFLTPRDGGYQLRWFTPAVEVDLCGHATVASAHVLWEDGHLAPGRQARFHTRSGLLLADQRGEWIELDFPAKPVEAAEAPAELLPALGLPHAVFVGKNVFDYFVARRGPEAGISISCRGSSRLGRASTKTRSRGRRIAPWGLTGASGWARANSPPSRLRRAAAWCA